MNDLMEGRRRRTGTNSPRSESEACELSLVLPCLDEQETLGLCLAEGRGFLEAAGVRGEWIVADNGSLDDSHRIARAMEARVVRVRERGYGAALRAGIAAARGEFVIMGDSDASYDFHHLGAFLRELRRGAHIVMGNRFAGGIEPGAMPFLHRWLGNPGLTWIARTFLGVPCSDVYCGLRGFRREAILALELERPGMEFALEMLTRAVEEGLTIAEVPTRLRKDGRDRPPHLNTWRDGWRSLRFLASVAWKRFQRARLPVSSRVKNRHESAERG